MNLRRLSMRVQSAQMEATAERCKTESAGSEVAKLHKLLALAEAQSNTLRSELEDSSREAALERSRADMLRSEFQQHNVAAALHSPFSNGVPMGSQRVPMELQWGPMRVQREQRERRSAQAPGTPQMTLGWIPE